MANIQLTVLGSGTSMGVPTLGCHCAVCESTDTHDKRTRPSILLERAGRNVVVDTTPDFRMQAMRARLERLDAVLYTHAHADHIMGLDDIRPYNLKQKGLIPIYRLGGNTGYNSAAVFLYFRWRADGKFPAGRGAACD